MKSAPRTPKCPHPAPPGPRCGHARRLIRPSPSSRQRLLHLNLNPRAQLLRRRRSQHVPSRHLVQDRTEHAPSTSHSQPVHPQPILQAAVGRLDPRSLRVPLGEHRRLLLSTPTGQAVFLVAELHRVPTVPRRVDRTTRAERTARARRRRHLDPRHAGRRISLDHQRHLPAGAGFDLPGPLVHGEIVHRQCLGSPHRLRAGDRSYEVHAAPRGGPDILVAAIRRVGQHLLGGRPDPAS